MPMMGELALPRLISLWSLPKSPPLVTGQAFAKVPLAGRSYRENVGDRGEKTNRRRPRCGRRRLFYRRMLSKIIWA